MAQHYDVDVRMNYSHRKLQGQNIGTHPNCLEGHPRHPQTQTPASTEDYNTIDREEFSKGRGTALTTGH